MKLAVLNPGGNDPEQHFPDGAGIPDEKVHAPTNFHAYAACTGGSFHRKDAAIPAESKAVMLLLRRDLKACRRALVELRRAGRTVMISLKETGAHQVAELLADPAKLDVFQEICERSAGAIAATEDLVPIYRAAGVREVEFLPNPYPVNDSRWDFSAENAVDPASGEPVERRGIFIGTREFRVPSRNHLAALFAIRPVAESMWQPVTVFNFDGWRGRRLLARLGYPEGLLVVIEGFLPYPRYLRLIARHRLVFQLDASAVPGQVAGDALLCRAPCVGGNGAVERLVFPGSCGHGRTTEQLVDLAARLLDHPHDGIALAERAVELARQTVSFETLAKRLRGFYAPFLG